MGALPFHQVSEVGEVGGEPWRLADRLLSGERRRGHRNSWRQSQSFSAGWDGHANISLGRAAFVQRADIAQWVGDLARRANINGGPRKRRACPTSRSTVR